MNVKDKGRRGEHEFEDLAVGELGREVVQRNFGQARDGGADVLLGDKWAVQVKRQEALSLGKWWAQALQDAVSVGMVPAVAYRQNRKGWKVRVHISDVLNGGPRWESEGYLVDMNLDAFFFLVREVL